MLLDARLREHVHSLRYRLTSLMLGALLSGCMSQNYFVDARLKTVELSQLQQLERPRPTQVLFSFRTRGLVDTAMSDKLERDVMGVLAASHLFDSVAEDPVKGGAILNVSVDSEPNTEGEVSRAIGSGLTLGVVGSTRTDPYVCTVEYFPSFDAPKIAASEHHAIYIPIGVIDSRPKNAVLAKSRMDAIRTVTRECITAVLKALSADSEFRRQGQVP